jgi:GNAT superfamily N-acetyltransferase
VLEMIIRALVQSDFERFKALRLDALKSEPDAFGETFEDASRLGDGEWSDKLAGILSSGGVIFVAEVEGEFVGMCGVGEDRERRGHGFVWGVFVKKSYRKSGAGSRLMDAAEDWAEGRGLRSVNGWVAAPNDDAIRFYRRRGYAVGETFEPIRPGSDIPVHPISKQFAPRPSV